MRKESKDPQTIVVGDKIVGRTTSGNFSFNYKKNISYGYVNSGNTREDLIGKKIFIEVEKIKYSAKVLLKPLNSKDFKIL